MKKILLYIFLSALLALLACSSNSIEEVKNGYIVINSKTTVGQAFFAYPYFRKVSWSLAEKNARGAEQNAVLVTGYFDLAKVRAAAPFIVSPLEQAAVAPLLEASTRIPPQDIEARYEVRFARQEHTGSLFEVRSGEFVFTSPRPEIQAAVDRLETEIRDAGLQGLRDVYSRNTVTIKMLLGGIALASEKTSPSAATMPQRPGA